MPRATFRRSAKPKAFLLQKPNGVLTDRVQKVGPEHFGIVAIDCAKARSRTRAVTSARPSTVFARRSHSTTCAIASSPSR